MEQAGGDWLDALNAVRLGYRGTTARPIKRQAAMPPAGRFKCQALLSEKSMLAAMKYVDLNPVRAKIAKGVSTSRYTGVKLRNRQIQNNSEQANQLLRPLIGTRSFNMPAITEADYIELVDFTGRQLHGGK
jgi:putative transposase